MLTDDPLQPEQILTGPLFNEPMRVLTVRPSGTDSVEVGLVGQQSERFRQVTLTLSDIADLQISGDEFSYDGDGQLVRLGLHAYSLGIAHEFDPYFGLSISRVDPLPHQLEAVYEYFLKVPSVRFLLADDAGAGKTIMAGLLIRELKLRGLVERILVVCPANLSFQWQREMKEKFDQQFIVFKGSDIRNQFGSNQWLEHNQVITSLDLAKREDILPSLQQAHWDLVIVDEAHRMSARDETHKSQRYRLGELLRDSANNILLLTATPHKGDPLNFSLFLQLLDQDAYADVKSIRQAMDRRQAPFYLRRTKEAMVYFPERQENGVWAAKPVFTKRITKSAGFNIDGEEFGLYKEVTRFVKQQSIRAAAQGDDRRARAVGFLMSLYQRRLASSSYAMRRSLENRARRLEDGLSQAQQLARTAPPDIDWDDFEEMEDADRERMERLLDAITLAGNADEVHREISELRNLASKAKSVEDSGAETKVNELKSILRSEGFFDDSERRLLIFTEFKDTLDYLVKKLNDWGFRVGQIHGSMNVGARDETGTRLYVEQQFRDGDIQILVATEAAGEGINLQCCNVLFNFDIPWNPNRLEQRMGRIHRYGQQLDCIIFNFVAVNTIEGRVLQRLMFKLQEIRDALDDDAVFNVVGEVLPATQVERVFREYYAGKMGEDDLEERLLRDVDESRFREICQNALEGLAVNNLNLNMLVERKARAQERRVVPESIARFMSDSAKHVPMRLGPVRGINHAFSPIRRVPLALKKYENDSDWNLGALASRYPRLSTDRTVAEKHNLEWVTPGHPLFEALRRHSLDAGQDSLHKGACFYSLNHQRPARMDFYRARIVDGLANVIHEKVFVVELAEDNKRRLVDPDILGNLTPAGNPDQLPAVATLPEDTGFLHQQALTPFLNDVRTERIAEVDRISEHVEISLTEVLNQLDQEIGRASNEIVEQVVGAQGRLAIAETRYDEANARRERRRLEFRRQKALTLQGVERLTSIVVLPHPDGDDPEVKRLRPNEETEMTAMRVVMEYEESLGRQVKDVHEQNMGYDVTSLDVISGELRLIEVKGLAAATGTILLSPNERRVAEDRRDCYWLYIVTNCAATPQIQEPIKDPARFEWREVSKVQHYWMEVNAMTKPMQVREEQTPYA